MDFPTYLFEWDHLFEEAERHGGIQMNDAAKSWLFWSRTNYSDKSIADLRLKVNGDLNRWREMVHLQLKISKNEQASLEQHTGYRNYYDGYSTADYDEQYDDWYDEYDENYDEDWYGYDDYYGWDYDYDDDGWNYSTDDGSYPPTPADGAPTAPSE